MKVVIVCAGWADGKPCDHEGQFLRRYNAEAFAGRGDVQWTNRAERALVFEDQKEAFELWRTVPKNRVTRADGELNRPLTAYNISIEPVPQ